MMRIILHCRRQHVVSTTDGTQRLTTGDPALHNAFVLGESIVSHDIRFDTAEPLEAQYWELFESTGWNAVYRVNPADLWRGFRSSWFHVCAYDGAKLVGSGRLVSDGVLYAVFFDIIVIPSHQRSGIGTGIVNRLFDRCNEVGIRDALLFSTRGTENFYRRFGFTPRLPEAPGMILRRT